MLFQRMKLIKIFLNFLSSDYPKLFDLLGTMYGNDVDNWSSMEQAKLR